MLPMERDGHVRDFMEDLQIRHVLFVIMDIYMIQYRIVVDRDVVPVIHSTMEFV